MTAKQLWEEFAVQHSIGHCEYEAWSFGAQPDLLAQLVASGQKTATASAYALYELEQQPLPQIGKYDVILDSRGEAVCIIQTKKVYVTPFCDVTEEHAYKEGEGDRSLDFWRKTHQQFFAQCLQEVGLKFSPDMQVVCEEFELVHPKVQ